MPSEFKTQVPRDHYYTKDYNTLDRFISYFYQIDLVNKLNPKTLLEIGIGNKIVSNYLKQQKFKIKTCDFDKNLDADYVADIRKLPFKDDSYDLILACEVLEHIPWKDFNSALRELERVTKKYVIISLPCSLVVFELLFKFPLVNNILKRPFVHLRFKMDNLFVNKHEFDGQHYWEIGKKDYPIKKIRDLIKKRFIILEEISPVLNKHQQFFILEKRKE